MNTQLVNSLVEVVLSLSSEDQNLFQAQFTEKQKEKSTQKYLTPMEKAEQFRQWIADFHKSEASLSTESLQRENIYDIKVD